MANSCPGATGPVVGESAVLLPGEAVADKAYILCAARQMFVKLYKPLINFTISKTKKSLSFCRLHTVYYRYMNPDPRGSDLSVPNAPSHPVVLIS